jgi:transcriptional regulator with XRE-family HTH domain
LTGLELKRARQALGLTGAQFAKAFDVHETTLWRWENGRIRHNGKPTPVPETIAKLVEAALASPKMRRRLNITK